MMKLTANPLDLLTETMIAPGAIATAESEEDTPSRGFPMRRDDEVEAIGMDVTMRHERGRGWTPTDVSRDGEDAISRLNPEMLYRPIQYLVEEDVWAWQGKEVIG